MHCPHTHRLTALTVTCRLHLLLVLKCTLHMLTDTHAHSQCQQPTHLRVVQLVLLAVDAQRGEAAGAGQDRVCGAPAALLRCPGLVSFVCRTHHTTAAARDTRGSAVSTPAQAGLDINKPVAD